MNDLIDQLIVVIRQEEELLGEFLQCLTEQKEFIVANRVEEFDTSVIREEELIVSIRRIEEARTKLVRSIASTTGAADDELTLTRLIEINLGEASEELKNLKRTLAGLVEKIKRANRVNQYLIRRSLSLIQKNVDWLIDGGDVNTLYAADGRPRRRGMNTVLVNKVL